ncbi:MAG TPA: molybdopterin-dependent oxidoreductase, partial [Candidatus Sulfotelmatobacter sp.]|nr:molybdopterin-dependent oxidoreductase [Candidatus Sulfotelmatobacter sp.]
MTNGWIDIKNADMMLIMGGNPAENHPCGFKWVVEAKRTRNAKLLVVDPRFTRTASVSDMFLQIRAGTDIAFLGGLINYALQKNYIARDYLVNYTNASFIIKEGFKLPDDGLYSGYDAQAMKYDVSTWNYEEGADVTPKDAAAAIAAATSTLVKPPAGAKPAAAKAAAPARYGAPAAAAPPS